jgi:hypothetical protein
MDGRGRWRDNVFVERIWKSIKYEEVYLHAYNSVPPPYFLLIDDAPSVVMGTRGRNEGNSRGATSPCVSNTQTRR